MSDTHATRADIAQIGMDIRDGFDKLLTLLAGGMQHPGPVQQVTVPQSISQPQRSERIVWVVAALALFLAMLALSLGVMVTLQGQRISDMRTDMQRDIDRLERRLELHAEWARQESNITRGYIWTGKVPVANPYPKDTEVKP